MEMETKLKMFLRGVEYQFKNEILKFDWVKKNNKALYEMKLVYTSEALSAAVSKNINEQTLKAFIKLNPYLWDHIHDTIVIKENEPSIETVNFGFYSFVCEHLDGVIAQKIKNK